MKSIKLKLVLLYLALVFIVMLVSGTIMLNRIEKQETTKANESIIGFAKNIKEQILQEIDDPLLFQEGFKMYSEDTNNVRGYILNDMGKAIAATDFSEGSDGGYRQFSSPAVQSAILGTPKLSSGKDITSNGRYKSWLEYSEPVSKFINNEEQNYIIFTRTEQKPIYDMLMEIAMIFVFTVFIALILTVVLGMLFSNTLTGPIITLTTKAKEMADGNLNQKIPVFGQDEIGQLTESFNYMATKLSETMENLVGEKNKMEIILHNMTDGVIAYDSNGNLIHANLAAHELLNEENLEEIDFVTIMDILDIDLDEKTSFTELKDISVPVEDKFISINFTPYSNKQGQTAGIVMVLQDITKHRKLDDMRKEFVANVSHEIRTPLTTIKGYAETLLDGALEEKELAIDFLNVINSEADRMTVLTQDLLELSRFDNKQLKLEFQEVNLIEILKQCIRQNNILAEKKNQNIIFNEPKNDFIMLGDKARLNQVFTNIISNAIKYGYENIDIVITTEETDKSYKIYIKDSGIGIPKEDLKRVFERFYRVDKARSRAMGGTGLGLAIAKEIIEAHSGKISVSSENKVGTTMLLEFEKSL